MQLQCSIFSTTFNPNRQRLGNKVLRQRLKGPQLAAYYPRKSATIEDVLNEFKKFGLKGWSEEEEDRLEGLQIAKLRGKGAPKKKRTAEGAFKAPLAGQEYTDSYDSQPKAQGQEEVIVHDRSLRFVYNMIPWRMCSTEGDDVQNRLIGTLTIAQ